MGWAVTRYSWPRRGEAAGGQGQGTCGGQRLRCDEPEIDFGLVGVGEKVEYDVEDDAAKGKPRAINVTGPDGANCKGAPRRRRRPRKEKEGEDGADAGGDAAAE